MAPPSQSLNILPESKAQIAAPAPPKATSLDRASLASWRFSETNGFLVKDFTTTEDGDEPMTFAVKSSDVFEVIADAAEKGKKISIYAVGPCVLDWS